MYDCNWDFILVGNIILNVLFFYVRVVYHEDQINDRRTFLRQFHYSYKTIR